MAFVYVNKLPQQKSKDKWETEPNDTIYFYTNDLIND